MPDRLEKLKEIVKELEAEIESLEAIDPQAQQILEDTVGELRAALGRADTSALESQTLADRLEHAEAEFQVSHPTLSGIVLRIINALGQLGI
jgi:tRNA C32,U32 (ribose-2'-O)-methylase TrmJ